MAKYWALGALTLGLGFASLGSCGKKEIVVIGEDSANLAALETVSSIYSGKVDVRFQPEIFDDLLEKSNQDLALGTGQYDIIMQYNFQLASYVENDLVWSLADLSRDYPDVECPDPTALFSNAWAEVGFYYSDFNDEKSPPSPFGYPFATNTLLLAINNTMFEDPSNQERFRELTGRSLAPPVTWDEFHEVARFFSDNTDRQGVVLQGASGGWLYYEWAAILASQGIKVFPEKTYGWERASSAEISLSRSEVVAATRRYLDLKAYNAGGFEDVDASTQISLLQQGKAAMAVVWSDFAPALLNDGDRTFSLRPLPGEHSPLAGGSFYINKSTRHPRAAYEFVCWVLGADQQRTLLRENLGSPLKSAYSEQVLNESEFARAMAPSIERGVYAFEANKDSEAIQTAVTVALQRGWRQPERLEDFLAEADRNINQGRRRILASGK